MVEQPFTNERTSLLRRLERMVGSPETAEELAQETFVRAWRRLPRDAAPDHQRAWLHRTATNLAVDELRRHRRATPVALWEAAPVAAADGLPDLVVDEALASLDPADAFLLRLRWDAGFPHADIAAILGISTEAARKRVFRARARFIEAYRSASRDGAPLVLLQHADGDGDQYVSWLERRGARVKRLDEARLERELASAQALVVAGSHADLHPALYGEVPRAELDSIDLARDRHDLATVQTAVEHGVPVLGICRGHQLLNIARGGSLYQDLDQDGVARLPHRQARHAIETRAGSRVRRAHGSRGTVFSHHHQAIARIGRGLDVPARSADGVVEAIELRDRRFAVGVLWHPEADDAGSRGDAIADALLEAA